MSRGEESGVTSVFWPSTGKKGKPGFVVSVWWGGQVSGIEHIKSSVRRALSM